MIKVLKNLKQLNDWQIAVHQSEDFTGVGFVPTMGALHEGHLSLVNYSKAENSHTIVSIFVNPTQFNDKKDFENYPITLEKDIEMLSEAKVDAVFCPNSEIIYPFGYKNQITENDLANILCGQYRPGHFNGMLTVVLKLFNLVLPNRAYFGEKDYQQFLLIKQMVNDFFLPIDVKSCPIIRENSGLALSSRNQHLSVLGKEKAALIYQTISKLDQSIQECKQILFNYGIEVQYLEEYFGRRFVAAFVENVRLIDNVSLN